MGGGGAVSVTAHHVSVVGCMANQPPVEKAHISLYSLLKAAWKARYYPGNSCRLKRT